MNRALITNIQKYSVHDGPGIRTTVFFKGCPLKCMWCHNPESQSYYKQMMYNKEKCNLCGECKRRCSNGAIHIEAEKINVEFKKCNFCENCVEFCINNAREIVGQEYTTSELMKEIEKDKIFYEQSGGGLTLSGGEVMHQIDFVHEIARQCKAKGIFVAIDTCGYISFHHFEKVLEYVDVFLYDLKLMNSQKHEKYTGVPNEMILENLKKLSEKGAKIHLRLPLIEGVNTDNENVNAIVDFIKNLNIIHINLLPYHEIGSDKYKRLNMKYEYDLMKKPSDERLQEIKRLFEKNNFKVKIGG
ncbi:trans-4-hydroxy-L-proline dehydratase activase [Clostridium formicaceticum]|uniref:4-hydroxyphenylacetate decarboxylase activating enzyme n=1 Tax=Clostridium formicaceticum TaxID=1497 RepID=A0AAC9RJV5_9CLOT|nr:trans-4-hydroxy-L-proline dehydratase activase [Clostridium formicaceticum]AOY77847.1 radical SAM protein [Clostridium formicaceticum]ARE88459.1 4-hydroxyphenylacetate decarboxylase activating enzyme [Clostridium formicaceticum]